MLAFYKEWWYARTVRMLEKFKFLFFFNSFWVEFSQVIWVYSYTLSRSNTSRFSLRFKGEIFVLMSLDLVSWKTMRCTHWWLACKSGPSGTGQAPQWSSSCGKSERGERGCSCKRKELVLPWPTVTSLAAVCGPRSQEFMGPASTRLGSPGEAGTPSGWEVTQLNWAGRCAVGVFGGALWRQWCPCGKPATSLTLAMRWQTSASPENWLIRGKRCFPASYASQKPSC